MIEALRRAWGKVWSTPRLPDQCPTGTEPRLVLHPGLMGYSATIECVAPPWSPPSALAALVPPAPAARPTWAAYDALMAAHQSYPGWTFCKFGVRGPRAADHSEVQGIVRAPFGAWWAPFLCVDGNTGFKTNRGLACVEHTRTGMAIGVFGDMDIAVEAAEIAMRMDEWASFDFERDTSMQLIMRVRTAWDAAGIILSSFACYPTVHGKVPDGQGPVAIFIKNPMADHHRPEKLS